MAGSFASEDAKTKAAYAEGTTLFAQGKYDPAYAAIGAILAEMNTSTTFVEQVKGITTLGAKPPAPMPKEPERKEPPKKEPPKKEPEKKEPAAEPKPEPGEGMEDDPDKTQKEQIANLAKGVDLYRQNLIVLALKIRVKKGEAEKGIEQLDLLKKYGGSIEANIGTLEQITNEMAAQIVGLRRENKQEEAKALSDGFAKLLDKLSAEPGLPTSVQRFLGQSLIIVGQYDKAVDALKKVPPPANLATLAKPNEIADPAERRVVNEYRRASLELLRAYRQSNKFAEADAVLAAAMGEPAKPGWAVNSVDFRKEKAFLFEAKGAAAPPAMAKQPWGEALKEWTALVRIYQGIVAKGPQPGAGAGNAFLAAQNNYYDMYLAHQRCLLKANLHLLPKGDMKFTKLFDDTGRNIANLEMLSGRTFTPDTRDNYREFIVEFKELQASYEKNVATALAGADQKAADRERDAKEMRAKAVKLREDAAAMKKPVPPEAAQYDDRAKLFEDDAVWIRSWKQSGGKFFLTTPMPTN